MSDPVSFFRDVAARHRRCFWLDGGGAREWSGRRSIIGWLDDDDVSLSWSAARREVREHRASSSTVVGDDVFAVLEERMRPGEQWFGYLGYASRPDLPAEPDPSLPDAMWMRPRAVRIFEHEPPEPLRESVPASSDPASPASDPASPAPSPASPVPPHMRGNPNFQGLARPQMFATRSRGPRPATPPRSYADAFAAVQEQLHAGNSYEVNLTHRLTRDADLDPVAAYLRLRELNPAPYSGFLQHDVAGARAWLLSSSPERYALVTPDRHLETKPIKGTTPRGATPEEDAAERERLAGDPKMRAENLMIVDLLRNDLSLVCDVGTVEVPALMQVETYASVHQLVSTVRGHLRDDVTTVGALRALFPAGSMTGAPKLRTMQIIEEVESSPRGVYAGAFGWISGDGPADLGVVIRSLMTDGGGTWTLGTGGGITVKSDVADEWAESEWKAERLLRVFE